MRLLAALFAACGIATGASAQQAPAPAPVHDAGIDALVADIAAGKRDSAIGRIASVESLSGDKHLASNPSEFVERLLGCTPLKDQMRAVFNGMIEVMWSCHGTNYRTVFDPKWRAPYITVGEFDDEAMMNRRIHAAPPPPPMLPRPNAAPVSLAPNMDVVNALAATVVSGEFDTVVALVSPTARIELGRRNVIAKVTISELDGTGPEGFVTQTRSAIEKVGPISTFSCDPNEYFSVCKFTPATAGRMLTAFVYTREGKVSNIEYMYATVESVQKDMAGPGR